MNDKTEAVEVPQEEEQERRPICGPKYRELYKKRGNPSHLSLIHI